MPNHTQDRDLADRLVSIRKRRGLSQPELAKAARLAASTVSKIERGELANPRLATIRALAGALGTTTSVLQGGISDTEQADAATNDVWAPVRHALAAPPAAEDDEPPTPANIRAELSRLQVELAAHRYRSIAADLPALLRDSAIAGDRSLHAHTLGAVGWLLTQNRQWEDAALVLDRAIETADDEATAAAAVATRVWSELRQGHLDPARALALEWADRIEPKFSRASLAQLAVWGRLWLFIATIAIRDNRQHEYDDAIGLARAAASRIGHEVITEVGSTRQFGPITVEHVAAEAAVLNEQPAVALDIAQRTPRPTLLPTAAGRLRHRLDKANAYSQLSDWDNAMGELRSLADQAPEWIVQQRYSRDIMGSIVERRRTLTDDMRELADMVRLEL